MHAPLRVVVRYVLAHIPPTIVDQLERIFFTGAEAAVSAVSLDKFDLPYYLIVPATMALAALKTAVAKRIGNKATAALLPKALDTTKG